MKKPILIYSGGGNRRFYDIAINAGFKYGARLPDTIYGPLYFADQNWKKPNRSVYIEAIKKHKPAMATVLDWEIEEQFQVVLNWAEEIAPYVTDILIVPKVKGGIKKISHRIGNKRVVLAYSIPTLYGSTLVPIEEFAGWPIHILGGSPNAQIAIWHRISKISDVISIDGNYYRMKATRFCEHWEPNGKWIPDGRKTPDGAHYEAFRKSCKNINKFWSELCEKYKLI